ncbi:amidohydrolase family protein [Pseudooceanicola sp.]|uniref:amidohydrolase family protein n=1 Tax=Pseudooceanicola sp. TaxID=1914328 RepID=UPI002620AAD3|nr:amidohydrolase family protein [Pseudooceanicola sp.]MDF1855923.1 amidohydrolase family protein [Pseudooceanicola sp.]
MSETSPAIRLPEGSTDCHFHIYGPADRFPYVTGERYSPRGDATLADAFALWERMGVSRGVIVHASTAGEDNAVTFEALKRYPDRLRAVAVLDPGVSDRRLDELTDAGFRGVRINLIRQDGQVMSNRGTSLDDLRKLAPRIAERGWHAQLWVECSDLAEAAPELDRLPLTYVVDHMCRTMADKGADHPDYLAFLDRLRSGRYWTKISGADRNTRIGRPYADTRSFMQAIVAAAPKQVVWGSDWPHVGHTPETVPEMTDLLAILMECVPDDSTRRQILIDNPKRLYGFD